MPSLPRGHLLICLPPSPVFRNSLLSGAFFQNDRARLGFHLAAQSACQANQTRPQEAECARLRNCDVGIAAGNLGLAVEERTSSVDGQLNRHTLHCGPGKPGAHHSTRQGVVMCPIGQSDQGPSDRSAEAAIENHAIVNTVGSVSGNDETSATIERGAHLQVPAAYQATSGETQGTQVASNQTQSTQPIHCNEC